MTAVLRLWPLLTATHRYDKTLSTQSRRGHDDRGTDPRRPDRDDKWPLALELSFSRRITPDGWIELSTLPWQQGCVLPLDRG